MTYPILEDGVAMETPDAQVAINNWVTNFKRLSQERDWLEIERDRLVKELADARAGMVPEGELDECPQCPAMHRPVSVRMCDECADARAKEIGAEDYEAGRREGSVSKEAELAKAWEAGRASAQACVKKFCVEPQDCYVDADIAALQPPGGKAK